MKRHRSSGQMIDFLEVKRVKHRVAVPQGMTWVAPSGGTGVARLFLVLFLVHAAVVAAIIVYDSMDRGSGSLSTAKSMDSQTVVATREQALPPVPVSLSKLPPIEDCATYEWRSGDSIGSVARKLGVSEEVLIEMNLLDKGVQLEANSIIRYPRAPVERAQALGSAFPVPTSTNAPVEAGKVAAVAQSNAATNKSLPTAEGEPGVAAVEPSPVAVSKPSPVLAATLEDALSPTPLIPASLPRLEPGARGMALPAAVLAVGPSPASSAETSSAIELPSSRPKAAVEAEPPLKPEAVEQPLKALPVGDEVPKAIALSAQELLALQSEAALAQEGGAAEHRVQEGDTFYSVARRHRISIKRLQAANPGVKPQALREGMRLVVPAP